jgi:hypothetical protein
MNQLARREFLGVGAAGLWGARRAFSETGGNALPGSQFTFAAINDTHVKDPASTTIVERAVAHINADSRIGFTVVLGDIACSGAGEELKLAKDALAKIACPWYALPGNHDVGLRDADIYANYRSFFGDTHWVHEQQGWMLIGFNSCEGVKSYVTVAEPELAWLREQAAKISTEQPVALFCHHPLNPHTSNYRILNADKILGIFKDHTLCLAAAGHWHGNQMEQQNHQLFTTTACCSSTRTNFDKTEARGYRLFHVKAGNIETEFVEITLETRLPQVVTETELNKEPS